MINHRILVFVIVRVWNYDDIGRACSYFIIFLLEISDEEELEKEKPDDDDAAESSESELS